MRKKKLHLCITRLLTLVCFFQFSGLNNGFTYFMVCPGSLKPAEKINFTTVVVGKCARVLNPAHWKEMAAFETWFEAFFRSGRVIELASQKAVQSMFVESSLFQIWINQSFAPPKESIKKQDGGRSLSVCVAYVEKCFQSAASFFSESKGRNMVEPAECITGSREESWMRVKRVDAWSGNKYRLGELAGFMACGKWRDQKDLSACARWVIKKYVKPFRVMPVLRIIFSLSDSSEGADADSAAGVRRT